MLDFAGVAVLVVSFFYLFEVDQKRLTIYVFVLKFSLFFDSFLPTLSTFVPACSCLH